MNFFSFVVLSCKIRRVNERTYITVHLNPQQRLYACIQWEAKQTVRGYVILDVSLLVPVTWLSRKSTTQAAKCNDKRFTSLPCFKFLCRKNLDVSASSARTRCCTASRRFAAVTLAGVVTAHGVDMPTEPLLSSINVVLVMAYGSLVSPRSEANGSANAVIWAIGAKTHADVTCIDRVKCSRHTKINAKPTE